MIMTVTEARQFITTNKTDAELAAMLQALELLVRKYTNNAFQRRAYRSLASIQGGAFALNAPFALAVGDTIQISESPLNDGLYTIKTISGESFTVNERTVNETDVLITKIVYPADVKMGVVNMLKWDLENREKVGIQSETLSRHSVTYFNMDGENSSVGYPKSLTGFLKPYMKARF